MPTFRWLQVPVTGGRHTLVASRKVEGCVLFASRRRHAVPDAYSLRAAAMLTDTSQCADRNIYCPYARHSGCFAFMRVMIHFYMRVIYVQFFVLHCYISYSLFCSNYNSVYCLIFD